MKAIGNETCFTRSVRGMVPPTLNCSCFSSTLLGLSLLCCVGACPIPTRGERAFPGEEIPSAKVASKCHPSADGGVSSAKTLPPGTMAHPPPQARNGGRGRQEQVRDRWNIRYVTYVAPIPLALDSMDRICFVRIEKWSNPVLKEKNPRK